MFLFVLTMTVMREWPSGCCEALTESQTHSTRRCRFRFKKECKQCSIRADSTDSTTGHEREDDRGGRMSSAPVV